MRRISKRVRDEAIEACLEASGHWLCDNRTATHPHHDLPRDVDDLLSAAWTAVGTAHSDEDSFSDTCGLSWLECAALLRDGWNPGDPAHLLTPSTAKES